ALVSSLWGKVSGPLLSAYCASKFAIEALADSARRETAGQDLHILVLEPGVVRTNIVTGQVQDATAAAQRISGEYKALYGPVYHDYADMVSKNADGSLTTDEAAQIIETAVFAAKPKARYNVGKDSRAITTLGRLLPDGALD